MIYATDQRAVATASLRREIHENWLEDSRVIWPIVDSEICGPINGFPRPDQWCAVAFDPDLQARICRLLNELEARNSICEMGDRGY